MQHWSAPADSHYVDVARTVDCISALASTESSTGGLCLGHTHKAWRAIPPLPTTCVEERWWKFSSTVQPVPSLYRRLSVVLIMLICTVTGEKWSIFGTSSTLVPLPEYQSKSQKP
jgi:hypothetical protein